MQISWQAGRAMAMSRHLVPGELGWSARGLDPLPWHGRCDCELSYPPLPLPTTTATGHDRRAVPRPARASSASPWPRSTMGPVSARRRRGESATLPPSHGIRMCGSAFWNRMLGDTETRFFAMRVRIRMRFRDAPGAGTGICGLGAAEVVSTWDCQCWLLGDA